MLRVAGYDMRDTRYERGFTLVELLVALMVTGIVLAAVATLAFALGAANDSSNDTAVKQAQVRYATLRISELIRHCKLICGTPGNDLAVWRADDNGDGKINPTELFYIEAGQNRNYLRLLEFSSGSGSIPLSSIQSGEVKPVLELYCSNRHIVLVPECSDVQFYPDDITPNSKFVSISFDLDEDGVTYSYQINTSLRAWAGHLLDGSGEIVYGDDD